MRFLSANSHLATVLCGRAGGTRCAGQRLPILRPGPQAQVYSFTCLLPGLLSGPSLRRCPALLPKRSAEDRRCYKIQLPLVFSLMENTLVFEQDLQQLKIVMVSKSKLLCEKPYTLLKSKIWERNPCYPSAEFHCTRRTISQAKSWSLVQLILSGGESHMLLYFHYFCLFNLMNCSNRYISIQTIFLLFASIRKD